MAKKTKTPVPTTRTKMVAKEEGSYSKKQLNKAILEGKESEFWQYTQINKNNDAKNKENFEKRQKAKRK